MWELQLEPGQSSGLHTHVYPYTFYVLNSSTLEVTGADGEVLLTFTGKVRRTHHT
jgi:quercetin dioxygenase-like cupin family protein